MTEVIPVTQASPTIRTMALSAMPENIKQAGNEIHVRYTGGDGYNLQKRLHVEKPRIIELTDLQTKKKYLCTLKQAKSSMKGQFILDVRLEEIKQEGQADVREEHGQGTADTQADHRAE